MASYQAEDLMHDPMAEVDISEHADPPRRPPLVRGETVRIRTTDRAPQQSYGVHFFVAHLVAVCYTWKATCDQPLNELVLANFLFYALHFIVFAIFDLVKIGAVRGFLKFVYYAGWLCIIVRGQNSWALTQECDAVLRSWGLTIVIIYLYIPVALVFIFVVCLGIDYCLHEHDQSNRIGALLKQFRNTTTTLSAPKSPEELCAICTDDYKDGEQITVLPCKHEFHHACIVRWAQSAENRQLSCPTCRSSMHAANDLP